MIITIDGPSGSGKSTIAKAIALALKFEYFETGAMYRAVTWYILDRNISVDDDKKILKALKTFSFEERKGHYFVNAKEISLLIRSKEVTSLVSKVSAKPFIRKLLVKIQRKFAKDKNAVFEGRDMGSVVFPRADLKIFLTADPKIRAERRYKELLEKFPGEQFNFESVFEDLKRRDDFDSLRKMSPLVCPKGAFIIDASKLSIEEIILKILSLLHKKNRLYRFFKALLRKFFKFCYTYQVFGLENLKAGGTIIAANHASFLDPPLVGVICDEEVHFLARSFKNRAFNRFMEKLNTHLISNKKTLQKAEELIRGGSKVVLFPEGTRTKSGEIGKIMPGIGFIAHSCKCAIIPLYIYGTDKIWRKGTTFPKLKGKIICMFGTPIKPELFSSMSKREAISFICDRVEQSLHRLKKTVAAKMI